MEFWKEEILFPEKIPNKPLLRGFNWGIMSSFILELLQGKIQMGQSLRNAFFRRLISINMNSLSILRRYQILE